MSESPSVSPLLPSLPRNRAVDEHLRRSLAVLRDQAADATLRDRIDDVISGRASLRALARDPAFSSMMEPLVTRGMQRLAELTPEERAAAEEGAAALDRGEGTPGSPEPAPPAPPAPPTHGTW